MKQWLATQRDLNRDLRAQPKPLWGVVSGAYGRRAFCVGRVGVVWRTR